MYVHVQLAENIEPISVFRFDLYQPSAPDASSTHDDAGRCTTYRDSTPRRAFQNHKALVDFRARLFVFQKISDISKFADTSYLSSEPTHYHTDNIIINGAFYSCSFYLLLDLPNRPPTHTSQPPSTSQSPSYYPPSSPPSPSPPSQSPPPTLP